MGAPTRWMNAAGRNIGTFKMPSPRFLHPWGVCLRSFLANGRKELELPLRATWHLRHEHESQLRRSIFERLSLAFRAALVAHDPPGLGYHVLGIQVFRLPGRHQFSLWRSAPRVDLCHAVQVALLKLSKNSPCYHANKSLILCQDKLTMLISFIFIDIYASERHRSLSGWFSASSHQGGGESLF